MKLNVPSEFELLLNQVSSSILVGQHDDFKHFLRVHSKHFHQNIFSTPDYTYKVLQKLATDPDLVVLSGDKYSSVVIMQRADYVNKLETMIEEGIANGKYMVTEDNTLKDLKSFQDFLTRNFKSSLPLNKIKPTSNQPAFLYGTAKTHKFQNPEQITKDNLKLRPIVSTYTCYTVDDDEVLVSYYVSSLFTEVPLDETIDHIIHEIYTNNTSYHNSAQSYSSDAFSVMSPRTQFSVLMASYINKLMDAAWATHYLQSLQTFSWLN